MTTSCLRWSRIWLPSGRTSTSRQHATAHHPPTYELAAAIDAFGYTSNQVVLAPARVLLAVPDKTIDGAVRSLKLEKNPYSPASRTVRPTVSLVAFQLSHQNLQNKLLIGCEYAHQAAAQWVDAGM